MPGLRWFVVVVVAAAEVIDGWWFDGRLSGQSGGKCPLLTQTAVEGLIKTDMAGGDDTSGGWVVHQIPVGVGRVSDVHALKCCVFHFTTLGCGYMHVGWASKNA
jgi:hypothetical protein